MREAIGDAISGHLTGCAVLSHLDTTRDYWHHHLVEMPLKWSAREALNQLTYDVTTVASVLGLSEGHVRLLLRARKLRGFKLSDGPTSTFRITALDLQRFITNRRARKARRSRYPQRDAAWWRDYHAAHRDD